MNHRFLVLAPVETEEHKERMIAEIESVLGMQPTRNEECNE